LNQQQQQPAKEKNNGASESLLESKGNIEAKDDNKNRLYSVHFLFFFFLFYYYCLSYIYHRGKWKGDIFWYSKYTKCLAHSRRISSSFFFFLSPFILLTWWDAMLFYRKVRRFSFLLFWQCRGKMQLNPRSNRIKFWHIAFPVIIWIISREVEIWCSFLIPSVSGLIIFLLIRKYLFGIQQICVRTYEVKFPFYLWGDLRW
jgi:hypothetical protein